MLIRYSRWDGAQAEAFSADDVMDHLAQEILDERSLESALRRLLQHGAEFSSGRRAMGLRDLLERIRGAREQRQRRYNLASSLEDIRHKLDNVVDTERQGIRRRLDGNEAPGSSDPMFRELLDKLARDRLDKLDRLPPDLGGRLQALRDYDFLDPDAREQFQELLKSLQEQVFQSTFQGLRQGIESLTPEALRQIREMARELNDLLERRMQGEQP
ncbi:MAG TPA: VWA domain-containing protein, partial [Chloroflexota bacterium]|nr:VWA domain-containing protein [Chloroflexota bacterium]